MTDRAAIVAKITNVIGTHTGADPRLLAIGERLMGQAHIDSLDLVEIGMALQEEFPALCRPDWRLEIGPDWTIEKIADVVIEQIAKEAARQ